MLFELYLIDISALGFSLRFVEVTVNRGSSSTFFGGVGWERGLNLPGSGGRDPTRVLCIPREGEPGKHLRKNSQMK